MIAKIQKIVKNRKKFKLVCTIYIVRINHYMQINQTAKNIKSCQKRPGFWKQKRGKKSGCFEKIGN